VIRLPVRYARADDGVTVAYSTIGEGPVTVVFVMPMVSQLEVAWEEPAVEQFLSRFASCARVVLFDRRGAGLSDQATDDGLGLQTLGLDIKAVLDRTDTEQAVLFGVTLGCPIAVHFAHAYPDRVQARVLAGGFAMLTRLRGYDFAADPTQVDTWATETASAWGSGAGLTAAAPGMRGNSRYRDWAARLERHTSSPGAVEALCRWAATIDVRPLLPDLLVPTLVIHRKDDRLLPATDSRYLAEHIPDAVYAELPGSEHTLFLGDQRVTVGVVTDFLDGAVTGGALRSALRRADRRDAGASGWDSLTLSEREVVRLIASGLTNKQVATRLSMSPHTVDGRLRRVFAKLGLNTRAELTAEYARVNG
jgi:pimeloyl-ACP methyl ester carboxylesterase/DNA-binding CsgD family transcriptional regulator